MRRRAALLAIPLALMLAACSAGTFEGYRVSAPEGWTDETDAAETSTGEDYQIVYEGPEDGDVVATIAIDREEVPEGRGLSAMARDARETLIDRLGDRIDAGPLRPARLAGRPAMAFDFERADARSRQIGAIHDGHLYVVTFTSARDTFNDRLPVFERLLGSWEWA